MRIEESLNVTFDESFPEPKSFSLIEYDRIMEPVVENPVRSPSLEANASELGYPKSVKEARGHPIEQVIGELNERTLRTYVKGMEVEQHCCFNKIKIMDGMEFNKDPIPFARILTTLVESIKNEHPEDTSRISKVDDGEQQSSDASPGQVSSALVVHSSYEEPPMKKLKVLLDIPIPASTPLNTFRLITIDVKRLADFKAEKEKSEKKLKRVITPEQLRAQEEELAAIEAKRVKMMDEFNHCTNFRDDYLPITKFSYRVNNAKFQWVATTARKLGISLPSQLTAFDLSTTEKKMKRRTKLIQEVFIKENIVVDGIQSNTKHSKIPKPENFSIWQLQLVQLPPVLVSSRERRLVGSFTFLIVNSLVGNTSHLFKMSDNTTKAQCKLCFHFLLASSNSTLKAYINKYCDTLKTVPEAVQSSRGRDEGIFVYNSDLVREQFSGLVIHEAFPFNHFDNPQMARVFQNHLQPKFNHVSRTTLKRDAMKLWKMAK
ncbi:hypothetical protein Tco_1360920 [Tanacetum coccineum]